MKNLFLLGLFGFLSCSTIFAQGPVLTRNKMMTFGSTSQLAKVSESTINLIDYEQTGENQLWDFSQLEDANPNITYISKIERPINTPFYTNYPLSNYVMIEEVFENNIPTSARYSYFNLSDTQMEREGSNNSIISGESSYYSDPQTEYVFPLSYGTVNEDTWAMDGSFFPGSTTLECIGSGTLKLPNGVYENVLLVHLVVDQILVSLNNYLWLSENGALLASYQVAQLLFQSEVSAMYVVNTDIVTSGLKNVKSIISNIQYNNPVQNTLELKIETINISDELQLSLANTLGMTVLTTDYPFGTNTINLDLSDLASGVYFLTINSISDPSAEPEVIKIIKQ